MVVVFRELGEIRKSGWKLSDYNKIEIIETEEEDF